MARKANAAETSQAETPAHAGPVVVMVPVGRLVPAAYNPRTRFDGIDELADSIRGMGLMTPLMVRELEAGPGLPMYEVVAGGRRLRACELIARTQPGFEVPCIVRQLSDEQALELAVLENNQRQDLDPIDEAHGFAALVKMGVSLSRIALRLGRSEDYVRGRIALCSLAPEWQEAVRARKVTLAAARALALGVTRDAIVSAAELRYTLQSATPLRPVTLGSVVQATRRLDAALWAMDEVVPGQLPDDEPNPTCATCTRRTDGQPSLLGTEHHDAVCLDATCWDAKTDDKLWELVERDLHERGALRMFPDDPFPIYSQWYDYISAHRLRPRVYAKEGPLDGQVYFLERDIAPSGRVIIKTPYMYEQRAEVAADEASSSTRTSTTQASNAPAASAGAEDRKREQEAQHRLHAHLRQYRDSAAHIIGELSAEDLLGAVSWRFLLEWALEGCDLIDEARQKLKAMLGYIAPANDDIDESEYWRGFLGQLAEADVMRAALFLFVADTTSAASWLNSTRLQNRVDLLEPQMRRLTDAAARAGVVVVP